MDEPLRPQSASLSHDTCFYHPRYGCSIFESGLAVPGQDWARTPGEAGLVNVGVDGPVFARADTGEVVVDAYPRMATPPAPMAAPPEPAAEPEPEPVPPPEPPPAPPPPAAAEPVMSRAEVMAALKAGGIPFAITAKTEVLLGLLKNPPA